MLEPLNWEKTATLLLALAFAACFVWYTRRKGALTLDGALSAAVLGLWVLYQAGPWWLLPLFFFFISGTLFGRLRRGAAPAADAKHGRARDIVQVLCNGGLYAALATFAGGAHREMALSLMALSLAVSTADTWSSEIGQYARQPTVDLLRWRAVPPGLSGGVSWAGTLAGLAGALAMALLCSMLLYHRLQASFLLLATAGGFAGMLLDSLLGASVQARYRDAETGALSDQPGPGRVLYSGAGWMSNDGVNWWSNLLVTLAGYWMWVG
ncbi:MAG: DUF92 domain-containing protein [Saprospiraceae bacterium]|nr:DUF92 domain-containing protein [Saprospiraceae bacterium]